MRSRLLVPGGLVAAVAAAAAVAVPAESATTSVSVRDNVFAPKAKTVKRGDTVRFVWRGRAPHDVVITGPRRARSEVQVSGTYRYRATRRGAHRVVCTIHPGMRMSLRVR
jgi:plastocyanin